MFSNSAPKLGERATTALPSPRRAGWADDGLDALRAAVDAVAGLAPRAPGDTSETGDDEVVARLCALPREIARLEAVLAAHLRALDIRQLHREDACRSASGWLARHTVLSPEASRGRAKLGRLLGDAPLTAAALAEGHVSLDAARELARAAGSDPEAFADVEEAFVAAAPHVSLRDLHNLVERWLDALDPARAADRDRRRWEGRRLHLADDLEGRCHGEFAIDPADGLLCREVLYRYEERLRAADASIDERRTATQLRADAFVLLLHDARRHLADPDHPLRHGTGAAGGATDRNHATPDEFQAENVSTTTDEHPVTGTGTPTTDRHPTATPPDEFRAENVSTTTDGHGPTGTASPTDDRGPSTGDDSNDPDEFRAGNDTPTAEEHSATGDGTRSKKRRPGRLPDVTITVPVELLGGAAGGVARFGELPVPIGTATASHLACCATTAALVCDQLDVPLAAGRAHREPPPHLRRAVMVRDGGCALCGMAPAYCHAHHIWYWEHGGPTDLGNLVALCHLHHREVHDGRWRVWIDGDDCRPRFRRIGAGETRPTGHEAPDRCCVAEHPGGGCGHESFTTSAEYRAARRAERGIAAA